MTDDDRKFLTEAMGECWHEDSGTHYFPLHFRGMPIQERSILCSQCHEKFKESERRTFTTWADFGAVWEWAQKQEWWFVPLEDIEQGKHPGFVKTHFVRDQDMDGRDLYGMTEDYIDPLRFPQLVVEFLKERKP